MSTILPAYNPADHLPPPADLFPSLRLTKHPTRQQDCRVYLSSAIAQRLGLKAYQPIDLLPPSAGHNYWHLDLRPTAKRRVAWHKDTRPRIDYLPLTAQLLGRESLTLCLVPGDPAFPGFYPLLPRAFFAAQP